MTEGEKRCGLGSFLPMSCRGRAEAFARRLHNRLRSLGSQDGDPCSSESSWLAGNEISSSSSVTSLQPRHTSTDSDIFVDFGIFDAPGSPQEELAETELTKFITNPKGDLHHLNLDECSCIKGNGDCDVIKRNSLDSDSSDGPYYDPENTDLESNDPLTNHVNGISSSHSSESRTEDRVFGQEIDKSLPSELPSSSECTLSSLSHTASEEGEFDESLTETVFDEFVPPSMTQTTSGWRLNFEPNKINSSNNNVYSAIDLESLKCNSISNNEDEIEIETNTNPQADISCSNEANSESYCSQLNIQQDLTIECPNTNTCIVKPAVEISTLEIQDTDESETYCNSVNVEDTGNLITELADINLLHVETIVPETENTDTDIEIGIEERIPRVRRCSSLKTGKTPPGTPGRKKIVRFADVLGLDLADVRTFMDEIPKIPISAYDDLSGADLSLSDSSLSGSSSSALDSVNASSKTLVPLFQQPGGEANFMDKIRNSQVCLENAMVKDSIALCVCGTVRVRNLDFHKSVHIRYSLDQWKSFADLQATYVENTCDGFTDKFSFTLYVHTMVVGQRLEIAVRFQCKGCQYWDNNAGDNYCFQCLPTCTTTSYAPITAPDDATWAGAAFYYNIWTAS